MFDLDSQPENPSIFVCAGCSGEKVSSDGPADLSGLADLIRERLNND
jgi:hypothetical protein